MKKLQKYKGLAVSFLLGSLYASPLYASPFCVSVQGMTPECIYTDVMECRQRAQQLNGLCTPNNAEFHLQPGIGKYCLVYSSRVSNCIYHDRNSCDAEAARNGAVCMESPSSEVQPDPYHQDPNSKY
ncbi:MAG TPA: hypothetical protein VFT64_11425 [Rickettsiales bacterium]|nr:hypothetical protein [Rickettsiales bacterium]